MLERRLAFTTVKLACAYFFVCPGLAYGLFTSRLPALKALTRASDGEIGLVLLCFGIASLAGLFTSKWLIGRFGSPKALANGSLVLICGIMFCGLATDPLQLALFLAVAGLGMGFCDVAMNALGIEIEQWYKIPCMSFLHASYSLGGMLGSVGGALFAGLGISPLLNCVVILGLYALLQPWARPRLPRRQPREITGGSPARRSLTRRIPFYVLLCGFLSMLGYASEGAVGEWGSLYLHDDKGASAQLAALVYAAFSLATVVGRLFGDGLRLSLGDFRLLLGGSLLAFTGMALVIALANPVLCLAGYMLMGLGLAPIVPILFSRAGSRGGLNPAEATTVVSLFSYAGLLFFPPLLGFIGDHGGLSASMLVILGACLVLAAGSFRVGRGRE